MVAITTRRVPRYTQTLHRAPTVAKAPSLKHGVAKHGAVVNRAQAPTRTGLARPDAPSSFPRDNPPLHRCLSAGHLPLEKHRR